MSLRPIQMPDPTSRCRVAVIGAGYMAREHLRAFRDVENVTLSGIFSRTRNRAAQLAEEYQIPYVCDSVDELFQRSGADLVVVAVRELSTSAICTECFNYPWTMLIEKPAGYDVDDAEKIARLARDKKIRAYVALNRRHYQSTLTVAADLGRRSAMRFITVHDQQDLTEARVAGQPDLVLKNWMYANSIHLVDYFSQFARGNPIEVTPIARWDASAPKHVVTWLRYDSGDQGLYMATWSGPGPWSVSVETPDIRWELRPLERASSQKAGTRVSDIAAPHEWDSKFKPGLRRQAQLAVDAALGKESILPTLEDALVTMRLTQWIYS